MSACSESRRAAAAGVESEVTQPSKRGGERRPVVLRAPALDTNGIDGTSKTLLPGRDLPRQPRELPAIGHHPRPQGGVFQRPAHRDLLGALRRGHRDPQRSMAGMVVAPERMKENLERSRGVVFSGTVLLELARRGVSREQAYEWVQRNAMRSFSEQRSFKALVLADPDIGTVLDASAIERAFDLGEQLKHVDDIFERVFQEVAV